MVSAEIRSTAVTFDGSTWTAEGGDVTITELRTWEDLYWADNVKFEADRPRAIVEYAIAGIGSGRILDADDAGPGCMEGRQ
jgi:hypothetical protein